MNFGGFENWIGFIIGAVMSGLLLVLGRHVSKMPIEKLTEEGLVARYIYGTVVLFVGNAIFLLFAPTLCGIKVMPWIIGNAIIAGVIRIAVGQYDIWKDNREAQKDKMQMMEQKLNGRQNG